MAVSSVGVGSGLDVEKIVTQLVELEKAPIKTLEVKAEQIQSKISAYGEIKSLTDDLNSAVRDLTLDRTWNTVKINSSSSSVANATMTGAAAAGSYNLDVVSLAQAQTSVTSKLAKGTAMGEAGTMAFTVGGVIHKVSVSATDTMDSLVSKINGNDALSKSVIASVVTDVDGNQQLMLRARETGTAGAFSLSVTKAPGAQDAWGEMPTAGSNLSKLMAQHSQQTTSESWAKGAKAEAAGSMDFTIATVPESSVSIAVEATDTLALIAAKINSNAQLTQHAVTASVVSDGAGGERLVINSQGPTFGFNGNGTGNIQSLKPGADSTTVSSVVGGQLAQDAKIRLNGVEMVGSSNTFADQIPGLSISISSVGSSLLAVNEDKEAIKASIQKFVDAYNALNTLLTDSTKYTEESKAAGVLQGDGSTVTLLNSLRMLTQGVAANATGLFSRLSDAGIQMLQGGKLSVDDAKLSTALGDMASLKSMFAAKADNLGQGGGLATNFKTFTDALLAGEGTIYSKTDSLEAQLKRNAEEQTRVEDRATTVEARLRAQYTALDVKMASLNSLSSYVEQMVTTWNKSKD